MGVIVVVALCVQLLAQTGDDLGGGAPLTGPSAADLGDAKEPEPPPPEVPTKAPTKTQTKTKATTTPATTTAATPAPTTTKAAPPVVPAVVGKDAMEKAAKLRLDVDTALEDAIDLGDTSTHKALQQKLDALAGAWVADGLFAADLELKPRLKLIKLRSALLAGRFDDADLALKEARAAGDTVLATMEPAPAKRLSAALRYFAAVIVDARARHQLFGSPSCGNVLGLKRLAADEARRRRKLLDEVAERYGVVARGPEKFWGRRAAFAVAALYEDVARGGLGSSSYRGISLPASSSIDVQDTAALLAPLMSQWLGEIRRSYGEILSAINSREPDPALAERIGARMTALANAALPEGETVENPWRNDLHEGVIRIARRPERRNAAGRFVPIESKVALAEMQAQLKKGPGTVDYAWALSGLATLAADKISVDDVKAALADKDIRVVVAGLVATERVVDAKGGGEKAVALREPVTAAWVAAVALAPKAKPFSTLQGSLFGAHERSLMALQAIARADRNAADAIVSDERLPAFERAWIIAELADARYAQRFDNWGWDKDERVAALAVWGGFAARGRNAGYLLRPTAEGLVGCVSRAAAPE